MTYPPSNAPTLNSRSQAIRKTTVAFSSLFKDIPFTKYDDAGVAIEQFKVPIVYSNKEKYIKRTEAEPGEISTKVQLTLPRIEYGLLELTYDPSRKLNQINKIRGCSSDGSAYVGSPVPYNFIFELTLYTRNIEEANQIMEYILPFFSADYNVLVNMVSELGIVKSIPITLNSESETEEDAIGDYDSKIRSVFRTLNFTARSYLYPAPKYYKPILQADTNIIIDNAKLGFMLSSNTGTFNIGDMVFQGKSYNRTTAVAQIVEYNPYMKTIGFIMKSGKLQSNTQIQNLSGTAIGIIDNPVNALAINIESTPIQNTYPVTLPYKFKVKVTDYSG